VKNADGKRRERTEKEWEGRSEGKAAAGLPQSKKRPLRKAAATKERAGLKLGSTNTKARKDHGKPGIGL